MDIQNFIFLESCLVVTITTRYNYNSRCYNYNNMYVFHQFMCFYHIPWWIISPVASEAPNNDVTLLQQLFAYVNFDESCATTALDSLHTHLWYLTGEFPLCLFSAKLTT